MTLYDNVKAGGYFWALENSRSPGHPIVLPVGCRIKIRVGGPQSKDFVSGRIERGLWVVEEGAAAGSYGSANAAVVAVHGGTSLNAWLYVVLKWDGSWTDADEVRRLASSAVDPTEASRLNWAIDFLRKHPKARGLTEAAIAIAAARLCERMDKD